MAVVSFVASLTAALALGVAPVGAQTDSVGPDACDPATLAALIAARDPDALEFIDLEATPEFLAITCTNLNGDDIPDALWALSSGGSGGAFRAGVAVSGTAGAAASIAHWVDGHSHLITGTVGGKPAIGSPRYRKGDANCCPSGGWRWRTYTPAADGGVKQSKLKTTRKRRCPIRAAK